MKPPYSEQAARFGARIAPHIAKVGAIVLCLAATWIIGLFSYAVLFDGLPFRRAAPFFLIGLLLYFGAWAQLALVRLGQRLARSEQGPQD